MVTISKIISDPSFSSTTKLVGILLLVQCEDEKTTTLEVNDESIASKVGKASREVYRSYEELSSKGYLRFGKAKRKTRLRPIELDLVADETFDQMLSHF